MTTLEIPTIPASFRTTVRPAGRIGRSERAAAVHAARERLVDTRAAAGAVTGPVARPAHSYDEYARRRAVLIGAERREHANWSIAMRVR